MQKGQTRSLAAGCARYRLSSVAAVAVLLIGTWQTGVFELFEESARLEAALLDLGAWGRGAFLVACTAPRESPEPPS